jgi:Rrf2 family protein
LAHFLKISEAASLALHTMIYLAYRSREKVTTREIAALFCCSEAHLSKVLQRLSKAGYVKPVRGPRGGFVLARPASKISLLEIYELVDGTVVTDESCPLGAYICRGDLCALGETLCRMENQVKKSLQETRLSQLVSVCAKREADGVK